MTSKHTTAIVTPNTKKNNNDDAFTRLYTSTTTASKHNKWLVHKKVLEERKRKINIAKEKQKKREEEERLRQLQKENKYYNNRTSARHLKTRKVNDLSYDIYGDDDDENNIALSQQERFEKIRIANAHTRVVANEERGFASNLYYVNRTSQRFATTRIPEYHYYNGSSSSSSSSNAIKKKRSTKKNKKNGGIRRLSSNIPKPKHYFRSSSRSGNNKKKRKKKQQKEKTTTTTMETVVIPQEGEEGQFFIPMIVAEDDNDDDNNIMDDSLPKLILEEPMLRLEEEEEYKDIISSTNTTASLFSISSGNHIDDDDDDDDDHKDDFRTVSSYDSTRSCNSDVYNISSFPSDELDDDDVRGIIEKTLSSSSISVWSPPSWMMNLPTKEKLETVFHLLDENATGTISMMKLYTAVPMMYPTYTKLTIPAEDNTSSGASFTSSNPIAFRTAFKSCCSTTKNKNITVTITITNDDEIEIKNKNYANEYVDQREFSFFIHYLVHYHNLSHYFTSSNPNEENIPIITREHFQQAVHDMDFLRFILEKDLIHDFFDMIDIHDHGSIQLEYICNYLAFHKSFDIIMDDEDNIMEF